MMDHADLNQVIVQVILDALILNFHLDVNQVSVPKIYYLVHPMKLLKQDVLKDLLVVRMVFADNHAQHIMDVHYPNLFIVQMVFALEIMVNVLEKAVVH
jgi:hypothetical protein